ncbi:GIY-YIG nuclease family protein [uncultured Ruegeria sp.]|uniref:GIY-YIG nuclease family protein n=1 Tax=uncultured Ruegeria sp. TaxID=259304 RepID=UPI00263807C7|nr:GIY-YIG nuclease family protein [uncultured Ruegeria sp.]
MTLPTYGYYMKYLFRSNTRRRSPRIRVFAKRAKIGTVYLLVSERNPRLFKIGFTERATQKRRRELEHSSGKRLTIGHTVSQPWAFTTEQRLHWIYRGRMFGTVPELGTEWFRLLPWESMRVVRWRINLIAKLTKWEAKMKLSWKKGFEIRTYSNPKVFPNKLEPNRPARNSDTTEAP